MSKFLNGVNANRELHIKQVNTLIRGSLDEYQNHQEHYEEWEDKKPAWDSNQYYEQRPVKPSVTEVKRLTLMLRSETLKLDKYL